MPALMVSTTTICSPALAPPIIWASISCLQPFISAFLVAHIFVNESCGYHPLPPFPFSGFHPSPPPPSRIAEKWPAVSCSGDSCHCISSTVTPIYCLFRHIGGAYHFNHPALYEADGVRLPYGFDGPDPFLRLYYVGGALVGDLIIGIP